MIYTNYNTYFYIKNLFSICFLWFYTILDWASISREYRGLGINFPKTQNNQHQDCGLNP
jgi:hypothetical protein